MTWDATSLQWMYSILTKLHSICTSIRYLHHKPRGKSVAYENTEGTGGKFREGSQSLVTSRLRTIDRTTEERAATCTSLSSSVSPFTLHSITHGTWMC
jgi:hypothetical protein